MKKIAQAAVTLCLFILASCTSGQLQSRTPKTPIPNDIPASVKQEIEKLYSSDATVRSKAAIKLDLMGKKASPAIPFLLDMLKDNHSVYSIVLGYTSPGKLSGKALANIADTSVIDTLLVILKNNKSVEGAHAAIALGEIGGAKIVESLIGRLNIKDHYFRSCIKEALKNTGEPVVKPLIAALNNEDSQIRLDIVETLGEIKDKRALNSLKAALNDTNFSVREKAAKVLDDFDWEPQTQEQKISYLTASAGDNYKNWEALVEIGQPAVESIVFALKNANTKIQKGAARTLAKIGGPKVIKPLNAALKDDNADVRKAAALSLGNIGNVDPIEPLIAALKDEDKYVREAVAWSLGKIGDTHAVEALIGVAKRKSLARANAVRALGDIGDTRALGVIVSALKDGRKIVREYAAEALGKLHNNRAIKPLINALQDENKYVREYAAESLAKLTNENFGQDQKKWQEWWDNKKR